MAAGARRRLRSRGKHLHHGVYYPKTRLSALKRLPPVLRSPASLIDYIASYKLSMVHKLRSSERYTPRRGPVATRTFAGPPASAPAALTGIYLVNYAIRSPGSEKTPGEIGVKEKFKTRCVFRACYSALQRRRRLSSEKQSRNEQITPSDSERLTEPACWRCVNSENFPDLKRFLQKLLLQMFKMYEVCRESAHSDIQFKKN